MYNIILVCQFGASTGMFASKMNEAAKKLNIDAKCTAYPESRLDEFIADADFVLLGPQIAYKKDEISATYSQYQNKIHLIDYMDFGMMNGEKIIKQLFTEEK